MKRVLLSLFVGIVLGLPIISYAVALGGIKTYSFLNEPLSAEIAVLSVKKKERIQVALAPNADFIKHGVQRSDVLNQLTFSLFNKGSRVYVKVSSTSRIKAPYLNFILQLKAPEGIVSREYAIFLDPRNMGKKSYVGKGQTKKVAPYYRKKKTSSQQFQHVQTQYNGSKRYGPVRKGETLWSIAKFTRPSSAVPVRDMLAAIQSANPSLKSGLKSGTMLHIPTIQGYAGYSGGEAPIPKIAGNQANKAKKTQVQAKKKKAVQPKPADISTSKEIVSAESAKAESAKAESAKAEAAKAEAVKAEAAKAEAAKAEAAKAEAAKAEAAKAEAAKAKAAKAKAAKAKATKAEAAKAEAAKAEAAKAEAAKAEAAKAEAAKAEAAKAETTKAETTKAETTKAETAKQLKSGEMSWFYDKLLLISAGIGALLLIGLLGIRKKKKQLEKVVLLDEKVVGDELVDKAANHSVTETDESLVVVSNRKNNDELAATSVDELSTGMRVTKNRKFHFSGHSKLAAIDKVTTSNSSELDIVLEEVTNQGEKSLLKKDWADDEANISLEDEIADLAETTEGAFSAGFDLTEGDELDDLWGSHVAVAEIDTIKSDEESLISFDLTAGDDEINSWAEVSVDLKEAASLVAVYDKTIPTDLVDSEQQSLLNNAVATPVSLSEQSHENEGLASSIQSPENSAISPEVELRVKMKLDLADSYHIIDDTQRAKELLLEAIAEGTKEQIKQAKTMLKSID